MTQYFQWIVLSALTGSPVLSAGILIVFWWTVDRFTLGVLPDPFKAVLRWQRSLKVRRELLNNPSDRRARHELAQYLTSRCRFTEAVALLRPNIEAGDEDIDTLLLMGTACMGAGHFEQAGVFLDGAAELNADFRVGEIDLVRGRGLLAKKDYAGARVALERLVKVRRGTVEGRVLLARALAGQGDDAAAALMKEEAWKEYLTAPRFQRRMERLWAWRARPSRPATYALLLLLAVTLFTLFGAPRLSQWASSMQGPATPYPYGAYGGGPVQGSPHASPGSPQPDDASE